MTYDVGQFQTFGESKTMGLAISSVFSRLFGQKQVRIMMLGLDAAGKTTILYKLKLGTVVASIPTVGFNVETVEHKNISFTVWDVAGNPRVWQHYLKDTEGLIYVVDCSDRERIEQSLGELHKMLDEDVLREAALLVFANKKDIPDAMTAAELTEKLNPKQLEKRRWHVQATCATEGEGLYEGLDWLSNELANK